MSFLLSNISSVLVSAASAMSILKLIGHIALIILFVVIALIVCVLFVPIRYQAKGNIDEMDFDFRVHWLLKILKIRFTYKDKATDYAFYLFGVRTKFLDEEYSNKRKIRREKRKAKKAAKRRNSRKKKYQKEHDKYKERFIKENNMQYEDLQRSDLNKDPTEDRTDVFQTSDTNIPGTQKAMDAAKKIIGIINAFREHRPIQLLWNDITRFLYRARPRKMTGEITYGFDDPAMTGKVLGIISNLYFLYQYDRFVIQPDFESEEAYISGQFRVKGYLQGLHGLVFVIRVLRKKQFKKFMNALKL